MSATDLKDAAADGGATDKETAVEEHEKSRHADADRTPDATTATTTAATSEDFPLPRHKPDWRGSGGVEDLDRPPHTAGVTGPSAAREVRTGVSTPRGTINTTSSAAARPGLMARATTALQLEPQRTTLRRVETRLAQKEAHPWEHWGITLGLPMIVLFDIVVPCIIYYSWYNRQAALWRGECAARFPGAAPCPLPRPEFDRDILGSSIASFGVGELWILLARAWRLFFRRDECAPLLSRSRWELDATCWVYLSAMVVALLPFVVGSSLVIPKLFLYGPSFLMGFLGVLMGVTTFLPFTIPIGINSQPRGSRLRPFIYYAAEDFVAVDGLQDRAFRARYNARYEANPLFRRFFARLTLWWMLGVCVYIGSVSAVIWTLDFHYAFGLSLGVLFAYIATWAAVTFVWVKVEMSREHRAFERAQDDKV